MGEIHELFVLALSLVWFAGATPDTYQEGPTIKKIQSRSKFSISIESSNLARKFQSRRLDLPTKIGPRWVARSRIPFSLEIFNLARNLDFF